MSGEATASAAELAGVIRARLAGSLEDPRGEIAGALDKLEARAARGDWLRVEFAKLELGDDDYAIVRVSNATPSKVDEIVAQLAGVFPAGRSLVVSADLDIAALPLATLDELVARRRDV